MITQPLLFTVILNTNRREDTLACLESLLNNSYTNHRALVLDNASSDGSVEAIQARYPTVTVISLEKNLGYAGNNNVGIQAALAQGAEWVFVLNEDTILAEDCLAELVTAAKADPQIGILGPMVYHHNEPAVIQSAGGKLGPKWESIHIGQNELDQGQFNHIRPVDWVSGCAILVRREVIEQIGMLDERFFYYWEETEWCLRTSQAGWKILHVPQAKLWHKGVQRDYRPNPNVTYYSTRNRLLMIQKHHAPLPIRFAAWSQMLRTLFSWSLRPKWREMRPHRDAMWQGVQDYLRRRWGKREVHTKA
jgi:GT2 family glycosyltransferase